MEFLDLPPMLSASGCVRLPGSKSISNRFLMLAALAEGTTEIRDLLSSDDTERMLESLVLLGLSVEKIENSVYRVQGTGGQGFPVKQADLFLGNAGTAFRPLTAALALANGEYRLHGVPRMHERPIGDLVDALRSAGAEIDYEANPGYPPLNIRPGQIGSGGVVRVRGDVSSQFLTALLMALPTTGGQTTIEVIGELISKPYIEITLNLMARFGVQVQRDGWSRFVIPSNSRYVSPGVVYVEGDASSASYFLAAGAIGGGPVRVEGVGKASIQGDVRFADALAAMGAEISWGDNWIEAKGPQGGKLKAFDLDLNHIPDAAMTLAVAALYADGPCTLRNIASWRVKETDRIAAMATELRKVGADVEEGEDYLKVSAPALVQTAAIDTYDDHRMAMCFSLATFAGCGQRINDPKCVNKTFPTYFNEFSRIANAIPVIAIDGPSASGKGTVAGRVAEALGYHYLDSGALYRVVTFAALKHQIALDDEERLGELAHALPVVFAGDQILFEGENIAEGIRTEVVSVGASKVAALPKVRAGLLARQRAYRQAPGLVGDGRDMGSVVFPDAKVKVFLTATAEVRADRRYKQLISKGMTANINDLLQDLRERDARDSARAVAPLQQLPDAALCETSDMTIQDAVDFVLNLVGKH